MVEPLFQIFECSNENCRLRMPSDLSVKKLFNCPFCSSEMQPVGSPFGNYHPARNAGNHNNFSLLLDNLRSTENVGSIFRSADGAGVSHIYCCGTTPTAKHPKVKKASLGAELTVSTSYHHNSLVLAAELRAAHALIIALESTPESTSLFDFAFSSNSQQETILVIGNEISGIDPQLLSLADHVVHLPMAGKKTSLNAAVAAGIALYHLVFQHK